MGGCSSRGQVKRARASRVLVPSGPGSMPMPHVKDTACRTCNNSHHSRHGSVQVLGRGCSCMCNGRRQLSSHVCACHQRRCPQRLPCLVLPYLPSPTPEIMIEPTVPHAQLRHRLRSTETCGRISPLFTPEEMHAPRCSPATAPPSRPACAIDRSTASYLHVIASLMPHRGTCEGRGWHSERHVANPTTTTAPPSRPQP